MSPLSMSLIVFTCVFGGALAGIGLRALLPEHHRSAESRDVVKLGMGLVATMSALLLGLLVASAKTSYDLQKSELTQVTSQVIFLDSILAHYGPETKEVRASLRAGVARGIDQIWPKEPAQARAMAPVSGADYSVYERIQQLAPKSEAQRALQAEASTLAVGLGQTRWLMLVQRGNSVSTALLIVVVFWLTIIFVSFGLFAPPNATVTAALCVCALSVSCAIFLILEMDRPYEGLLQISSAPLRDALARLGK
jgi:hypothetical protein